MTTALDVQDPSAILRVLGVRAPLLGEQASILGAPPAEGASGAPAYIASMLLARALVDITPPQLAAHHFHVSCRAGDVQHLRIEHPGTSLRVVAGRADAQHDIPDNPLALALVGIRPGDCFLLAGGETAPRLYIACDRPGHLVCGTITAQVEAAPLEWLPYAAPDWLVDAVRSAQDDSCGPTVGAGLVLRFADPDPAPTTALAAFLSVDGDPLSQRALDWWPQLAADRREDLVLTASVRATQTRLDAEDLEERLAPSESGWRAELVRLLEDRDSLESQRAMLHLVGGAEDLDAHLATLDAVLRSLVQGLAEPLHIDHPFLAEVADRTLGAWWAEPARR